MARSSIDILTKAKSELPLKTAPDHLWESISMQLPNDGLQKSVMELETKNAPANLWEEIDDQLADTSTLRKAIRDLPLRSQTKDLFDTMVDSGSSGRKQKWLYGIAATVVLFVASYIIFNPQADSTTLIFSEEIVEASPPIEDLFTENQSSDEVLSFIESNCQTAALKCESEEFKGLFDLYLELEDTYAALKIEAAENSEEVQLVKYLVDVEKEKMEIGKQLIYMIMS